MGGLPIDVLFRLGVQSMTALGIAVGAFGRGVVLEPDAQIACLICIVVRARGRPPALAMPTHIP